jgi:hypothetical protein
MFVIATFILALALIGTAAGAPENTRSRAAIAVFMTFALPWLAGLLSLLLLQAVGIGLILLHRIEEHLGRAAPTPTFRPEHPTGAACGQTASRARVVYNVWCAVRG